MKKEKNNANQIQTKKLTEDLRKVSVSNSEDVLKMFNTSLEGLDEEKAEQSQDKYGENVITHGNKEPLIKKIFDAFINPFTVILLVLAIVSTITDIILVEPGEEQPMTVIIIVAMVLISGLLRLVQELRSGDAAEKLLEMIQTTTCVQRTDIGKKEIPLEDVVVGDIIHISAGDMIPGDMRILSAKDLFITQSSLTGESEPVEKIPLKTKSVEKFTSITDSPNIAFMGCNVISGTAIGVLVAVGNNTIFGDMAKTLDKNQEVTTTFEEGVNSVSWILIRFMLIMVPIVFVINGITKDDWLHALMFAISIAVGLTPEMLPMIVTTCLAKGAVSMSKEKTIIKNLNSIQNLGSIDILCTDKTGTLTQDKVVLQYHMDIHGDEDVRVLRHAFLNSYYQTGLVNLMDVAIIDRTSIEEENDNSLKNLTTNYVKVDEIPFDFERRRMSVVVEDKSGKTQMITKGAVEEMLYISSFAEFEGKVVPLTDEIKNYILEKVNDLNDDGMRVIAVAQKKGHAPVGYFSVADETEMVLIGYLAFLDPPKESTAKAIQALHEHGVEVKVLTGDNEKITRYVCSQVGINHKQIVLGDEVEKMEDEELAAVAEKIDIFAKLSPQQKARVITVLREAGHSVGYMGDGINDAAGMQAADIGISVDTAVDIAKESADVILLEKDLMVLEKGIIEGRKTYANMIKYIKMTASSNFGNVLSVLIASAFLPFMPMMSIHLILLNLIYDLSCTTIPWDNVDNEYIKAPRKWEAKSVGDFMIWFGPTSSIFDITTYLLMYFIICPMMTGGQLYHQITDPSVALKYIALFQAGWFIESMWTQSFVIHMIRTPKIPFIQSRASWSVTALSFTGIAVLTIIPFTPFGASINLAPLPAVYFGWLLLTVALYMVLVTIVKKIYINKFGELL